MTPRAFAMARLARWLGPWADTTRAPDVVVVDDVLAGGDGGGSHDDRGRDDRDGGGSGSDIERRGGRGDRGDDDRGGSGRDSERRGGRGDRGDDDRGGGGSGRGDDDRGGARGDDDRGGDRGDDDRGGGRDSERRGDRGDRGDDDRGSGGGGGGSDIEGRGGRDRSDDNRGGDRSDDNRGGGRGDDDRGGGSGSDIEGRGGGGDRSDDNRGGDRSDDNRGGGRGDDDRGGSDIDRRGRPGNDDRRGDRGDDARGRGRGGDVRGRGRGDHDRGSGALRVRTYRPHGLRPGDERAAFLIAPGLHYAGPDDVRMDRFCRVLASAGHLVIAPFIPSYLALIPRRAAIEDFTRVFAARARWTDRKPVVFSISFGSLLAFALAADHADALDGLVVFGGYADFHATLRFCLTGEVASGRRALRDPLNQPVVLMNLLAHLEPPVADPEAVSAVSAGWRAYVERTWGRPEMKAPERFTQIADELAPTLPASVRELFHIGVGTRPGAAALARDALTRFVADELDPTPYLPRVRGRVDLVHGTDDDVIPFEHSHELAAKLTAADVRVHITGLYGHTGAQRPKLSALAHELATMVRVLRVFAR